jgi:cob(I)alamin adenosyltransferase
MILLIIGLSLSFVAIGTLFYLGYQKNKHIENKLKNSSKALLALQKEFTQYQVSEKRVKEKSVARMEIRHDNIAKSIKKNEDRIYLIKKTLPNKIGEIVSQIEFAQNKINRK